MVGSHSSFGAILYKQEDIIKHMNKIHCTLDDLSSLEREKKNKEWIDLIFCRYTLEQCNKHCALLLKSLLLDWGFICTDEYYQ